MTPAAAAEAREVFPELAGTRRFTADEYRRLIDAGILGPDEQVELLDGYVLYKPDSAAPPADQLFPRWGRLRRWTTGEYRRMIDLGVVTPDDKVELLGGYLVLKMGQSRAHRSAVVRLNTRLPRYLPPGWVVMSQVPVAVGGMDPEPDGAIVRGVDADYDDRDIDEGAFGIVVEVADSTLDMDRRAKGRLYARAGLPVYWIVNVLHRQVEVYTDPDPTASPAAYRTRTDYRPGDDVPIVLDGQMAASIPAADLLP
jgi:Uma2 family endonuclease